MKNADKFKRIFGTYATEIWTKPEKEFVDWLNEDVPEVNVVERKVGKWTNDKGLYKCSECGELWTHWWAGIVPPERMYKMMRFCPNCGAKMERSEDDH